MGCSHRRTTSSARALPPSPPLPQTSDRATFTPRALHFSSMRASSASVSSGEAVDGDHAGQAEDGGDVLHVAQQVGQAALQGFQVLRAQVGLGHAAVVLQGADGGHDDHSAGLKTGHAALDVQELLCAQVCAEARLGHNIVAQLEGDAGGHDGVAAVGDVGEGTAVDKGRGTLQGLDQVGFEGILQQGGHGPGCLQIASGHGLVVVGIGHDHAAETFLQVGDGGSQTQHCHDLGGHGDVKAVLTGHAVASGRPGRPRCSAAGGRSCPHSASR